MSELDKLKAKYREGLKTFYGDNYIGEKVVEYLDKAITEAYEAGKNEQRNEL